MKTNEELRRSIDDLKKEVREKINSYSCSFDRIKCGNQDKIHFVDTDFAVFEKEMCISEIIAEGSNVGIYPRSKKYLPHSENTIEDIHDLFFILNTIEDHLKN